MARTFGYYTPDIAAYFHFISFSHISLGVHVDLAAPNLEVHILFGFVRPGLNSNREHRKLFPRSHPEL